MKKIYVNIILVILICIFSVLSLMACSNENGRSSDNGKTTNEQGDKEKPSQDKNDKIVLVTTKTIPAKLPIRAKNESIDRWMKQTILMI